MILYCIVSTYLFVLINYILLPHLCLQVFTNIREHHTSGVTNTGVLMLPYVDTYSIVHAIWMKEE